MCILVTTAVAGLVPYGYLFPCGVYLVATAAAGARPLTSVMLSSSSSQTGCASDVQRTRLACPGTWDMCTTFGVGLPS